MALRAPGDDLLEEVARDVVGRQAALAVQRAGEAVLVLEAEDPALHVVLQGTGRPRHSSDRLCLPSPRSWRSSFAVGDAPELPALALAAVEDGDLEVALGQRLVLGDRQRADPELDGLGEGHPLLVVVLEEAADLVRLAAHRRVVLLVLDRAVVEDVVDLVLGPLPSPTSTTSTSTSNGLMSWVKMLPSAWE